MYSRGCVPALQSNIPFLSSQSLNTRSSFPVQLTCVFKLSDVKWNTINSTLLCNKKKKNSQQELSSGSRIIIQMTTFCLENNLFFLSLSHLPHLSAFYHPPIHMLLFSLPPFFQSTPNLVGPVLSIIHQYRQYLYRFNALTLRWMSE